MVFHDYPLPGCNDPGRRKRRVLYLRIQVETRLLPVMIATPGMPGLFLIFRISAVPHERTYLPDWSLESL